jgi:hypothetical protein
MVRTLPSFFAALALAPACRQDVPRSLGAGGSASSPVLAARDDTDASDLHAREDAVATGVPSPSATAKVRVDRKKLRAFLDRVRARVLHAEGIGCRHEEEEYLAFGKELDTILPSAPGVLEAALVDAARCIRCGHATPTHRSESCTAALDSLARAQAWVDAPER